MSTDSMTVLGLMTGTSLDGLDVVAADLSLGEGNRVQTADIRHNAFPYPDALRHRVLAVAEGRPLPADAFLTLHHDLGHWMARQAAEALRGWGATAQLAGLHGQTVWHRPAPHGEPECAPAGATWQMAEPAWLARMLACPVVHDFRANDMLLGGQGAPLAPLAQQHLLPTPHDGPLATLNLGGIANGAVFLPDGTVSASDFGPANVWLDTCLRLYGHDEPYDDGGGLAAQGTLDEDFLQRLKDWDRFVHVPPPRSTGREHYTEDALLHLLGDPRPALPGALHTLAHYTAWAVARGFRQIGWPGGENVRLCTSGGGVHHRVVMDALQARLKPYANVTPHELFGADPQAMEALYFAVLAFLRWHRVPLGQHGVTGIEGQALLGKITEI